MTFGRARNCSVALCIAVAAAGCTAQQSRPRITGISHLSVYASDMAATGAFYEHLIGSAKADDPEDARGARYYFSKTQFVEVLPLPADHTISRMAHVAYNTSDGAAMRAYLLAHNVPGVTELHTGSDKSHWFEAKDPEGNTVQFVQPAQDAAVAANAHAVSSRVIHIGFLVHDRAAEDAFYKSLLGFRPYWYGAMKPDKVDWISQQVPDGHDWLEYMMVGEGSTTPLDRIDQRQLGVLNHFSLGVANMEKAMTVMIGEERLSPRHDGPQMGKDGKWQANFYDPDGTRVEFMEFQPVIKPCCSEFTAESPAN